MLASIHLISLILKPVTEMNIREFLLLDVISGRAKFGDATGWGCCALEFDFFG